MAWRAAHLADSVAFSQTNNGNASFGKEQEGIGGLCASTVVFFSLWFLLCSYFTSQHIMHHVCQPASQPALLGCATLPSLLHVLVHVSTLERPPPSAYIGTVRVLRTPYKKLSARFSRNVFSLLSVLRWPVRDPPHIYIYCRFYNCLRQCRASRREEASTERAQANCERAIM